jgi:hypothetical protein
MIISKATHFTRTKPWNSADIVHALFVRFVLNKDEKIETWKSRMSLNYSTCPCDGVYSG